MYCVRTASENITVQFLLRINIRHLAIMPIYLTMCLHALRNVGVAEGGVSAQKEKEELKESNIHSRLIMIGIKFAFAWRHEIS